MPESLTAMPAIALENVSYIYGKGTPFEVQALKDVSFSVKKGSITGLIGHTGSGKSTIIQSLLNRDLNLSFSISATSRAPRGTEKNGIEYYFITPDEFRERIANDEFLCREVLRHFEKRSRTDSRLGEKCYFRCRRCRRTQHKKILRKPSSRFVYPATQHTSVGTTIEKQSDRYPGSYSSSDSES